MTPAEARRQSANRRLRSSALRRAGDVRRAAAAEACQWWALCANPATKTRAHPIIGAVPICDECDEKVERLS